MKILMVCLGNICRSPMAEGVLRHLARERGVKLTIDSAGTEGYHVGEAPDRRARSTMKRFGMDIDHLRARQVRREDLDRFDLLLAMDGTVLEEVRAMAPDARAAARVRGMMEFAPRIDPREVPDPYYGDEGDFEEVYRLLHAACNGLLDHLHGRR